ncbi:MAG: choice-of-anchor B family protein [Rhodothermaceae bacterium]|nr:choice-of-anchor B family protein [Rhodothermaceae bacterium]
MRAYTYLFLLLFFFAPKLGQAQGMPCDNGMADRYPCASVDLMAHVPIASMGGSNNTSGNDIWGWTDPGSGREFALVGLSTGTAFVEVTNPTQPIYLGSLATHTSSSTWRDLKVHDGYVYIVSEARNHGMQVFDLSQLLTVQSPPETFSATAHYDGFGSAHNIAINEKSGVAYAVGSSTCSGGLHFISLENPASPKNLGCFSQDGYTHDAQCVIYEGPDEDYQGREICVNSNEDTITIVDVTEKSAPIQIARESYPNASYVHQGWFTEDQQYFYQGDELDEAQTNTRTLIWDLTDLDDPFLAKEYFGPTRAVDHNLYILDDLAYETNYTAGLRILNISDPLNPVEVGYFDSFPANNNASFNGAWSNYPFFKSGNVIVSNIEDGLFIVRPDLGELPVELIAFEALLDDQSVSLVWETASETNNAGFDVEQLLRGEYQKVAFVQGFGTTNEPQSYSFRVEQLPVGEHSFRLKQIDFDGTVSYSDPVSVSILAPSGLALSEAYPNPFNPRTNIELTVAQTQHVKVQAYNTQGQEVGLLYDGLLDANAAHMIAFDASNLPSGFYLIRATGSQETVTQMVSLVK